MRTLFITYNYLKGNRGGIYASRTHINLFAALSEKVTLLHPYAKGMEPEGINADNIDFVPVEDHRNNIKKFLDLCLGYRHRFIGVAEQYINPDLFDIVVFDSSLVSSRLIMKFKKAGILPITIHHNYEIEYIKGDGDPLTKYPDLIWTYFQEKKAVRESYLNLTLTNQDAELFRQHYCNEANFATLGVFDYQTRIYQKLEDRNRGHHYLITGGLGSKQNEDSIIPWFQTYFPILKKIDPEAKLTLAGRSPSNQLIAVAHQAGAEVISSPDDMAPILESGDYYICPTDRGGGLKLRIMDGLKGGMPVLTHLVSARGYDRFVEADIVYPYSDEETFEKNLRLMLANTMTRRDIQSKYIENFSFENGVKILQRILQENKVL